MHDYLHCYKKLMDQQEWPYMQRHTGILDQIQGQHRLLAQDCYIPKTKHMQSYLVFVRKYQLLKLDLKHYPVTIYDQFDLDHSNHLNMNPLIDLKKLNE